MKQKDDIHDIFIVDSDVRIRNELKMVLRASGYKVRSFPDASQLLAVLKQNKPKLVVIELLLPGIDGFELCQIIRNNLNYIDLPLLCISGISWGNMDLDSLLKSRFNAYFLPKGFLATEFRACIRAILPKPALSASENCTSKDLSRSVTLETENKERMGLDDVVRVGNLTREFEQTIAKAPTQQQRREVRIRKEFSVRFRDVHEFIHEFTANISSGGLFVKTINLPQIDDIIDIQLEIPDHDDRVQVQARVVHHVDKDLAESSGQPIGFGAEFIDLTCEDRARFHALVQALQQNEAESVEADPFALSKAPLIAPPLWIVIIGLPKSVISERASFVHRNHIEMVEYSSIKAAHDFFVVHDTSLVVLGESGFVDDNAQKTLLQLKDMIDAQTQCIVILKRMQDLSALVSQGLCSLVLEPTFTMDHLLTEISDRLRILKRTNPRVSCSTNIRVHASGSAFFAHMMNVSCGGMLFRCEEKLTNGTNLAVAFELPDTALITCRAVVVRCHHEPGAAEHLVGVSFSDLNQKQFEILRKFIQSKVSFREYFNWIKNSYFPPGSAVQQ